MDGGNERTDGVAYYRLEVAAELVGLPPSRVRRYLKTGLVRAAAVDRGTPLLSAAELARLRKIRRLTSDLGVNLAGVEIVLRLLDELAELHTQGERSQPPGRRPF